MQTNHDSGGGTDKKLVWVLVATVVVVVLLGIALIGVVAYTVHARQEREEAQKREVAEFADSLKQQVDAIKEIQTGGTDAGRIDGVAGKKPTGQGMVAQLQGLMNKFMKEAAAFQISFKKQILETGIATLLDAQRLSKDKDLAKSREIIADVRKISLDCHAKMREMVKKMKDDVAAIQMTADERKGLNEGIEKGLGVSMKRTERIWALDLAMYDKMDMIVTLLSKQPRTWRAVEGKLIFDNEADLREYQTYWNDIQKDAKDQEDLQKEAIKSVDASVRQLKQGP